MDGSPVWTGWIVPRILPKSSQDDDDIDTVVSSINAMTSKYQVDPSLLCPGKGIQFHPFAPRIVDSDCRIGDISDRSNAYEDIAQLLIDEKSESTTIEVFLYPPQDNDAYRNTPAINIQLDRKSNECVDQTLNRMVLSLKKQIAKLTKSKLKKEKKQKQSQQQQASAIDNKICAYKITRNGQLKPWNIEGKSNMQTWTEALSSRVLIQLELANNITASFNVDTCPPTIVSVKTFEDFAGRVFHSIPLVVEVDSLFSTTVIVDWYIGDTLVCSNSTSYTPQSTDVGKHVSVLITPIRNTLQSGRGYERAYRFHHPIEDLPENTIVKLRRGIIWTDCNRRSKPPMANEPLRVMTYNILADQNAYARTSQGKQISFYPYVDTSILDRKRRMPLILHEILSYQSDIICLQEVDEFMFRRIFRPALEDAGYQGYWSGKDAHGMAEGCAMFWSLNRFESIPKDEMKCFSLNELVMDVAKECNNARWKSAACIAQVLDHRPDLKEIIENKLGHILQMVSLPLRRNEDEAKSNSIPDRVLVANTHLFYHPLGAHIRLMQMYAICRQFERFQIAESSSYPMILCGDMNSSLRRAAGYLLVNRHVLPDHTQIREHFNTFEWKERNSAMNNGEHCNEQEMRIEHDEEDSSDADWEDFPPIELPLHFPTFLPGYPNEPEFTHYLDSFAGSLDHIFVSQSSEHNMFGLSPFRCAPMPSVADVTEDVAMPSAKLPSDHVSLVADLTWTKNFLS